MSLDVFQTVDLIESLENFIEKIRPTKEEIRRKLDYGYSLEGQSVILYAIRPQWKNPEVLSQHPFAKATFIKKSGLWKVYWLRSNLKWYAYDPKPTVRSFKDFLKTVEDDKYHCFFG
jgi:Protein of unknown function (DUF3024)